MVKNNTKEKGEVIILQSKKSQALRGENNRRLNNKVPVGNAPNGAWSEIDKLRPHSKVSVPSVENVIDAKEWVDNGSRL